MKVFTLLFKIVSIVALLFAFIVGDGGIIVAQALTENDREAVLRETPYYDGDGNNDCTIPSNTMSSNKVYVVGDSYAVGLEPLLRTKLKDSGYDIVGYNAHTGRSIDGQGNESTGPNDLKESAQEAIVRDAEAIKLAGTILIVLGTNQGTTYNSQIPGFMKTINGYNSTARKFWINAGNQDPTLQSSVDSANKAIAKYADEFNYSVIDWRTKQQSDSTLMPSGVGQYHPNQKGYGVMSDMVIAAFGPASSASSGGGSITIPTVDPNKDMGKENEPVVWAYLISKGLSPIHVAALMGNLQAEGHFEPRIVQYGYLNSRGEVSVQGKPSSLDNNVPPNQESNGSPGYGLAQWTAPSRKQGLKDMAAKENIQAGSLDLQLRYLWKELDVGGVKHYVLNNLQKETDLGEATWVILDQYESPAEKEQKREERTRLAENILKKYAGQSYQYAGCGAERSLTSGKGGWEISDMVFYSQYDPKWNTYTYGDKGIQGCGCGPTSMAMIVSTLTGNMVDPPAMADYYTSAGLANSCGTNWIFNKPADKYNLKYNDIGQDLDKAAETLNAGGLVLISVGNDTNTYFTEGKHQLVIRKVSADGNTFFFADPIQRDPNADKNTKGLTRAELTSASNGSLNHMWTFNK